MALTTLTSHDHKTSESLDSGTHVHGCLQCEGMKQAYDDTVRIGHWIQVVVVQVSQACNTFLTKTVVAPSATIRLFLTFCPWNRTKGRMWASRNLLPVNTVFFHRFNLKGYSIMAASPTIRRSKTEPYLDEFGIFAGTLSRFT